MPAHRSRLIALDAPDQPPTDACVHDHLLGGALNFAADRRAGDELLRVLPAARALARESRAFLRRAVGTAFVRAGVRQFLDLGAGLPSAGDVHSLVAGAHHSVRLVLSDHDEVVVHAWRQTLVERRAAADAAAVLADVRNVPGLLERVGATRVLDFARPVCVLLTGVLDRLGPTDRPELVAAALREALPTGSWLVLSHLSSGRARPQDRAAVRAYAAAHTRLAGPLLDRSPADVEALLSGWDVLEPGVVPVAAWRPDRLRAVAANAAPALAAVGVLA